MRYKYALFQLLASLLIGGATPAFSAPVFGSFPDTIFDVIRPEDQNAFACLKDAGRGERQIWDKRVDGEPQVNAYLFQAYFTDGTQIELAINPEFGTRDNARIVAQMFTGPLGFLPTSLRRGIEKFSVHDGNKGFHAGTGQIIMYRAQAQRRIGEHQLEESVFHEAVHASWDAAHRLNQDWKEAQQQDGGFLTQYGQSSPQREDLADTAVFVFGLLHHPERLPPVDSADIRRAIPHRIEYIRGLLPPDKPLIYPVGPAFDCIDQSS